MQSWITYTLPQFVAQLNLMGTAPINGTGNDLNNKLVANNAGDVLSGAAGDDILNGGTGADTLIGGPGHDTLTGRTGSDTFVFNFADATSTDKVKDFSALDHDHDFVGVSHGQVMIPAGSTSATVLVNALEGNLSQVDSFSLQLESAVGVTSSTAFSIAGNTASGSLALLPPEVVAITDTITFGSLDPMGLAYVPSLGTLFLADPQLELLTRVQHLTGVDTLFGLNLDGTLQSGDALPLSFSTKPAGLAYDPSTGLMYISDDERLEMQIVNPANPTKEVGHFLLQGLTLAPASDDPTRMDLYVADQGNVATNDGRLIEINLHNGLLYA